MNVQTNHSIGLQQIFRRVRKIAKSDYSLRHVCPSVRPSVRLFEWNNSHRTAFYKMFYMSIFRECFEKIQFHYNMVRITGTLHEHQYKVLIISGTFLLRIRNISDKSCRENRNTYFTLNNFFPKIVPFK